MDAANMLVSQNQSPNICLVTKQNLEPTHIATSNFTSDVSFSDWTALRAGYVRPDSSLSENKGVGALSVVRTRRMSIVMFRSSAVAPD